MISFEVDDLQNMNERLSEFIGFLEASGVDDDAVRRGLRARFATGKLSLQ